MYINMYIICVYVYNMYACMCVCTISKCLCMYGCIYVRTWYYCMCVCLYVCIYEVYMYVYLYVCMHACMFACMHVCMYVYTHVSIYACMHVWTEYNKDQCGFNPNVWVAIFFLYASPFALVMADILFSLYVITSCNYSIPTRIAKYDAFGTTLAGQLVGRKVFGVCIIFV